MAVRITGKRLPAWMKDPDLPRFSGHGAEIVSGSRKLPRFNTELSGQASEEEISRWENILRNLSPEAREELYKQRMKSKAEFRTYRRQMDVEREKGEQARKMEEQGAEFAEEHGLVPHYVRGGQVTYGSAPTAKQPSFAERKYGLEREERAKRLEVLYNLADKGIIKINGFDVKGNAKFDVIDPLGRKRVEYEGNTKVTTVYDHTSGQWVEVAREEKAPEKVKEIKEGSTRAGIDPQTKKKTTEVYTGGQWVTAKGEPAKVGKEWQEKEKKSDTKAATAMLGKILAPDKELGAPDADMAWRRFLEYAPQMAGQGIDVNKVAMAIKARYGYPQDTEMMVAIYQARKASGSKYQILGVE